MAGISGTRVDIGAKGPEGKDKRTGGNKQDSSVVEPTRSSRPVSKVENDFTSEVSGAEPKTRPTNGSK
jgi:hypothetical protein